MQIKEIIIWHYLHNVMKLFNIKKPIFMKNNENHPLSRQTEKTCLILFPQKKKKNPNEIIEKICWKNIHNGAENRKGAISRSEIEIPGRQKADGIKQVKLEQKKHHI